jgi:hypothetical protein
LFIIYYEITASLHFFVTGYGGITWAIRNGGSFNLEPVHVAVIEPTALMLEPAS